MSLPAPTGQYGILDASAVSASDIWAVVEGGPGQRTANGLMHWNGRRWFSVTLPAYLARGTNLASVLALPGGDVVAGGIPSGHNDWGVTALWNGHAWTVDKLPSDPATKQDVISDLVPDEAGGVWAMGFTPESCAGPMWHFSARVWTDTGLVGCWRALTCTAPRVWPASRAPRRCGQLAGNLTPRSPTGRLAW